MLIVEEVLNIEDPEEVNRRIQACMSSGIATGFALGVETQKQYAKK